MPAQGRPLTFFPFSSSACPFIKTIKMKRTSIFLSFFITLSASAQTDTVALLPVEVKAVRAGDKAPFTKTNLTKAQIEKQNLGQDLPFILNQTPSVVVNSDAGTGIGYTGIRIRGTDAARTNVTLNGVPFNDAESQGTFFVNLPDFLSSANSIQVQRGVGTSSNGGSSFGASINVNTNEINKEQYLELNNSVGSFNTFKNTIKAGTGLLGDHFTADIRLSQISSDGYVDRAKSDLKSYYFSTAYASEKTGLRFTTFSGKEKTYQSWNGVLEELLKKNRTQNSAGTERTGAPYDNETDNYNQTHYQTFFNQQLKPGLVLSTGLFYVRGKGYYEQYKADRKYANYGIPKPIYGTDTVLRTDLIRQLWLDNHYYGTLFSVQHNKPKTSLIVGGSASNYKGDHFGDVIWAKNGLPEEKFRWYNNRGTKKELNLYTKWQQNISAEWLFYTDFQVRNVHYNLAGFRDHPELSFKNNYFFFNPKAGVSFSKENWLGYASYGIANKEPNRDDFEAGATQAPLPERLRNVEIGLEQRGKTANWGATFFYMNYKNQLVLTGKINDVGAYTRTNIAKSYRAGVELQGAVRVNQWLQASGNLALSKNRILEFTEFIDDYDAGGQKIINYNETSISFSPPIVGAATVTLLGLKGFELNLMSKYVGKQYLDNTENNNRKLDAYFTEDVSLSYLFSKKALKRVRVMAQVNNIFNALYEPNGYTFSYYADGALTTENYYFPMAGTNWMVGLNVRL